MPTSVPSRQFIFRLAAASAFAVVALTACNPAGGETTIESSALGDDPAVAPVATSPPVAVEAAASTEPTAPVELPELAEPTELTELPSELVPVTDEAADSTEATDVVVEPAAVDGVTEASAESGDDTESGEATETAAFNVTGANCMDGRWIAAPGEIQLYFGTIGLANGVDMNGSGHLIIVLEDGSYTYDAHIVNQINVDGFPTTAVVDGVTQGSYTYENGFIVATETVGSLDASIDLGGVQIDATDLGEDFAQMGAFHEAPYDCNGNNPSIYFDVAPGVARYEMKFTPWDGTRP